MVRNGIVAERDGDSVRGWFEVADGAKVDNAWEVLGQSGYLWVREKSLFQVPFILNIIYPRMVFLNKVKKSEEYSGYVAWCWGRYG